jgi:hypothetical protein
MTSQLKTLLPGRRRQRRCRLRHRISHAAAGRPSWSHSYHRRRGLPDRSGAARAEQVGWVDLRQVQRQRRGVQGLQRPLQGDRGLLPCPGHGQPVRVPVLQPLIGRSQPATQHAARAPREQRALRLARCVHEVGGRISAADATDAAGVKRTALRTIARHAVEQGRIRGLRGPGGGYGPATSHRRPRTPT